MTNRPEALRSARVCEAAKADGSPCNSFALPDRGTCFAHTREMQERATEARRRGGQNTSRAARARKALPRGMTDVQDRLMEALAQVHEGQLDPRIATAMASLAGALVRVFEVGELTVRLEELEAQVERREG